MSTSLSRRTFIAGSAGFILSASASTAGPATDATRRSLSAWLRISNDDSVTIVLAQSEMGQGISTTLPMALADELGADWSRVRLEWSGFAAEYRHPQYQWMFTGNSESISTFFSMMRTIGAAARMTLIRAAAARLGVSEGDLVAKDGVIVHAVSGRKLTFGCVAGDAAKLDVPSDPPIKPMGALRLIGRSQPRSDIPAKVDGSAVFGMDVKIPGMLVAAIRRAPSQGGSLASFDEAAIRAHKGVVAVVRIPSGLAVVAKDYWSARQALDQANLTFVPGPLADYSTEAQQLDHRSRLANGPFEIKWSLPCRGA